MGFFGKLFGRKADGKEEEKPKGAVASGPSPGPSSAPAPAPPPAPPPAAARKSGASCPECGRTLLPGATRCPFCTPQQFTDDIEGTIAGTYSPKVGAVAMGGVISAYQVAEQHGARGFLHVFEGKNAGESVLLADKTVTIGRGPGNVLALNDGGVSTRHCDVRRNHWGYYLVDGGSTNGTFVNEKRVKERQLANGDLISFGATRIYVGLRATGTGA